MFANYKPSVVQIPIAVDPNLMASIAYSTWSKRPSGEYVLTPLSYSERVRNTEAKKRTFLRNCSMTKQNLG